MTLKPFTYVPAESLQAAQALLGEHAGQAAVLAGGTDLLGVLKDAIHDDAPALLIGLKPLADQRYVQETPEGVRIGALTTLAEIAQTIKQSTDRRPAILVVGRVVALREHLRSGRFAHSAAGTWTPAWA